ncbi:hypothetical protein [Sinorhizobium meliloti]|uniref:hypothetical protein n=1 Tax=Rhizobium meliloti TaxID=382 RepID=UPI0010720ADD|nr:hypothetical protein [Sinorhizobium meliloti]MQW30154.1 hypothetical protein [Sinorhizobium meliloti]
MAGLKDIIGSIIAELKATQAAEDFPGPNHGFPGLIDAGDRGSLLERDAFRRNRKGDSFFCANQIHHSGR